MNRIKCIVCLGADYKHLYTVNSFPIVQCLSCGYVFSEAFSEKIDFSKLYGDSYFHGDDYINYTADEKTIKKNFRNFLGIVQKFQPDGRLLEIGSAYGFFLDEAQKHYDCIGQEISNVASGFTASKKNWTILNGDLLDLPLEQKSFDLAVMWDAIEHLPRPDLYLEKVHGLLKNHGYLFLTTGNIEGLVPKINGQRWRLIKPPWHLHYFSKKTIALMLRRLNYDIVNIHSIGFHRSLGMILIKLLGGGGPTGQSLAENLLNVLNLKSKSIYLNLYDIMFVVARKSG